MMKENGIVLVLVVFTLSLIITPFSNPMHPEYEKSYSEPVNSETVLNANHRATGMSNPAAVYCGLPDFFWEDLNESDPELLEYFINNSLNYSFDIINETDGQRGICTMPDGIECDAWDFLRGLCGQNWSYCALMGYNMTTKHDGNNSFSVNYSVCIDPVTGEEIGSVTDLLNLTEEVQLHLCQSFLGLWRNQYPIFSF